MADWTPNCRYTQFVIRISSSQRARLPKTLFLADPELIRFNRNVTDTRIALRNEALLQLHEALYLIGIETGASTSNFIHDFIVKTLSMEFKHFIQISTNKEREQKFTEYLKRALLENYQHFQSQSSAAITQSLGGWQKELVDANEKIRRLLADQDINGLPADETTIAKILQYLHNDTAAIFAYASRITMVTHSWNRVVRLEDLFDQNVVKATNNFRILCASFEYDKRRLARPGDENPFKEKKPSHLEMVKISQQFCVDKNITFTRDFYQQTFFH